MSQIIFRYLSCEKCFLQFDNKYAFDQHLALVHREEIKLKTETIIKEENLKWLQQSEKTFEIYKCNNCSAAFPMKSHLKKHVTSVHEGKKPFQCSICDYCFSQTSNFSMQLM